ncbi:MAG: hypothetical protein RIC55_12965 [Pirellulaceae bacterium]
MVFEQIEQLKSEYTDKYVVVDAERPELRRFRGMTGTVRTVNMSGRALVEFDANNNIGWFDIDLDFLKVVDAPPPKEEKPAKAAAKGKAAPKAKAEKPKAAPAAKEAAKPAGGKMSVAEMLAAARGQGGGSAAPAKSPPGKSAPGKSAPAKSEAAPAAAKDPKSMSVAEMLAAARGNKPAGGTAAAKPADSGDDADAVRAKLEAARKSSSGDAPAASTPQAAAPSKQPAKDPKSMSVAEMLAAARGEKSGGAAAAPPAAEEEVAAEPEAAAEPEEESSEPVAEKPALSKDELPTDIGEIVALCRRLDAK